MPSTLISTVAEFVAEQPAGVLPASDDAIVKDVIADCLACAVIGTTTKFGKIALEHGQRYGLPAAGAPAATAVGCPVPLSVSGAAWVNTVLVNAFDYEPVGPEGHVAAAVVPTALAVAESAGSSGQELLDAVLLGVEVGGRIGAAIRRPAFAGNNNRTPGVQGMAYALIGAAAAAARLMHLSADQTAQAMAIAAYSAPVPTLRAASNASIAPMTKYDALAVHSRNAIEAAQLADLDARGDTEILEGDYGFWRIVGSPGLDPAAITEGLGSAWTTQTEIYFKRYPCVLYTSPVLEAIAELRDKRPGIAADLTSVEIRTRDPKPGQRSRHAETDEDAWYSIPVNAALTLLGGHPRRTWRDPVVYNSAPVRRIAEMTDVDRWREGFPEAAPGQGPWSGWAPCKVTVYGDGWSEEVRRDGLTRLTHDELDRKWAECFSVLLSEQQTAQLSAAIADLAHGYPASLMTMLAG